MPAPSLRLLETLLRPCLALVLRFPASISKLMRPLTLVFGAAQPPITPSLAPMLSLAAPPAAAPTDLPAISPLPSLDPAPPRRMLAPRPTAERQR
ncbi:uncharacterized protein CLUP02_02811 [Colletotrichum lupini]|uniref:Secreted protein n=1 Tax=Colletotrichum lupini TaxID=145971 RepID=A0A9Q8SHR0_9PEZI|nr:uncharacterized protein CLUP02_02811 [Colletotrichum lupini]KAK1701837.1 hypothetical protein BDP67DRAFT_539159 [Colletotrichum lupini]UQC77343.1 hypothetical protein CLUP02_02811 [Colletotrichum lupini]